MPSTNSASDAAVGGSPAEASTDDASTERWSRNQKEHEKKQDRGRDEGSVPCSNNGGGGGRSTWQQQQPQQHPCGGGRWHKYVKPRVGQMFQVDKKVLRSLSLMQCAEDTDSERSTSAAASAPVASSPTAAQESFHFASTARRHRASRGRGAVVRLNETLGVKAAHQVAAAASLCVVTYRGGLCIHRPPPADGPFCGGGGGGGGDDDDDSIGDEGNERNEFVRFARNIILQTPSWTSPAALESVERRWKEIEDKYGGAAFRRCESSVGSGIGRRNRGGRKRKAPESNGAGNGLPGGGGRGAVASSSSSSSSSDKEDDDSSRVSALEAGPALAATDALVPSTLCLVGKRGRMDLPSLEEDDRMLAYLQIMHRGNSKMAKFSTLSDLSMGRAVQARRHLRKRRKEEEMEAPLSDMLYPSESWRRRYERLSGAMVGDVKCRPGVSKYPYFFSGKVAYADNPAGSGLFVNGEKTSAAPQSQVDDRSSTSDAGALKLVWRSVLKCADEIVSRTDGGGSGAPKPALVDLLTLLRKAHTLVRPEEVFGKRDTSVKRISQCMNSIVDSVVVARNYLAKLVDIVYDEKDEGIDLDYLEKYIATVVSKSPVVIGETDIVQKMLSEATLWEKRLDRVLRPDCSDRSSVFEDFDRNNVLAAVEQLALDAHVLPIRPRSLVLLERRIEKTRVLRDRIREMKQSEAREGSENKRLIASLVREAGKLDLAFPELTMLTEVHEAVQEWTDRAAVAVRSRLSLSELEELVDRGETMPVNLSDLLDKLRARVAQAKSWIARLWEKLGIKCEDGDDDDGDMDDATLLGLIRNVLNGNENASATEIQDLAVIGSRIPVDMPHLQLLQVEVDARNWSMKARRLLEKKGKIDDFREHLLRGGAIRNKVPLSPEKKAVWVLDFEKDLSSVVEKSDAWYKEYRPYLEGDNRRSDGRCCMSITLLRKIVAEGNGIDANLGNASVKMNRILSQAESWFDEHKALLARFKVVAEDSAASSSASANDWVKMDAVNAALENASELPIDLEEAMQLKDLADRSHSWFCRALAIAPKRSKRSARGKKKVNQVKHSLNELESLVQEASGLPIDISEDLERLQMQLTEVQSWRLQAQSELRLIAVAFGKLRNERLAYYGVPDSHTDKPSEEKSLAVLDSDDSNRQSVPKATKASEGLKVHRMIGNLVKSVQSIGIYTIEEEAAEILGRVSKWCTKAAMLIATPAQIFEKRSFKDLDGLIEEGEMLLRENKNEGTEEVRGEVEALVTEARSSWISLVSDDKIRLEKCRERRNEFVAWCEKTDAVMSVGDKKIPIETLREIGGQSLVYPKSVDTVKKIQVLLHEANAWIEETKAIVESGQKISLEDAKSRVAKGESLNISCPEFRNLRNALRVARGWQLRVKRSKLDSGQSQISDIKALIEEHNGFLVCLPDEIKRLKEALQGYCLCRRPYEGFMVGCDSCEEWFHGPCIGLSESQAERCDKYVCVRCVISKLFKGCAETTVQAIRKWTNSKDLAKYRQIDGQRHQRKVREKRREIEKTKTEIEALKAGLDEGATISSCLAKDEIRDELFSPDQKDGTETASDQSDEEHSPVSDPDHIEQFHSSGMSSVGDNGPKEQESHDDSFPDSKVVSAFHSPSEKKVDCSTQGGSAKYSSDVDEIREKLSKAFAALENSQRRMDQLGEILRERKDREAREDAMNLSLQRWFIFVRSTVLIPSTEEKARLSRPQTDGNLSAPMAQAVTEATRLGIRNLPDVSLVINALGCMSWCFRALFILEKKPKIEDIRNLISQSEGDSFKLPETKCVRMLQSPLSRASIWQAKAAKALKPLPGEKKPFEIEILSGLLQGARDIPYTMPEESELWNTIEDDGNRHCICGGPSDGRFMINCDKCEVWYHGDCVKLDKSQGDVQSKWICPPCTGAISRETWQSQAMNENSAERKTALDVKDPEHAYAEDVSPYAPKASKLWPPYGLLQADEALAVLGVSDPSECEEIDSLAHFERADASTSITSGNVSISDVPRREPPTHSKRTEASITLSASGPDAREGPLVEETRNHEKTLASPIASYRVPLDAQHLTSGSEKIGLIVGNRGMHTSSLPSEPHIFCQEREQVNQSSRVSDTESGQQYRAPFILRGMERCPQAPEASERSAVHHSLQHMFGRGRLPLSLSSHRSDSAQVAQTMQLMGQPLKVPRADQIQASHAMQMLAQRTEGLSAGFITPTNRCSQQQQKIRMVIDGRERLAQAAAADNLNRETNFSSRSMQLNPGRLSQQAVEGRARMAMQPPAMQLIQGRNPYHSQHSSSLVVPSFSVGGTIQNQSDMGGVNSINGAQFSRSHLEAGNQLLSQRSVSMSNLSAEMGANGVVGPHQQQHVNGAFRGVSAVTCNDQGSDAPKQLISPAAIVSHVNYSSGKG